MVGTVMTGLLLGILLSRTVSGVVGAVFGWRVMYQAAAVSVALIGTVMARPAALRCALDAELSAADGLDGASVAALPGITPRRASSGRALHRL